MKSTLRQWLQVAGLCLCLGCASQVAAQTRAQTDSAQLVNAVNVGDYVTALEILRRYGITNGTLEAMAARLGRPPPRVALADPFLKSWEPGPTRAFTQDTFMARRTTEAVAIGYPRLVWMVQSAGNGMELREAQHRQSAVPPIGVMDVWLAETNVMGFLQWYDRHAEGLHSVALNWENLNNRDARDHGQAYLLLNALFQLVKARKPDAFVWLAVKPSVDKSDVHWLQTMRFEYDGLVVGEMADFTAQFERIRRRYLPYVREGTPMVAAEFCGYNHALRRAANLGKGDDRAGRVAYAEAGKVVARQLPRQEERLQELGYRGLILDLRLVRALADAALAGQ